MSNGLDDLSNRRRRGRTAPPPKHPRSEQPPLPETEPVPDSAPEPVVEPARQPRSKAPAPALRQDPGRSDATRAKRAPSVEAYLDEPLMDWLWQVEAEAVGQRMRSVNSPVVRLALRRLQEQMSPAEVVQALRENKPAPTGKPGRPRR
ncbi:hypothetical protein ACFWTE_11670 [Nocardiopsis sp. NPDC058631]|uniref:hypothetical protein n=1 Tax=Nocardiopsis sp. NPDC058631 TaxID=3346566 RepID=UPI003664DF13